MHFFNRVKTNLVFLIKFTRFLSWVPTLQQNLTAALLLLLLSPVSTIAYLNFMVFIIIQFFMLAYTFVVNDVGDKAFDIKAGKIKPIQNYSKMKTALILSLLAVGSLVFPLYYGNLWVMVISIVTFIKTHTIQGTRSLGTIGCRCGTEVCLVLDLCDFHFNSAFDNCLFYRLVISNRIPR